MDQTAKILYRPPGRTEDILLYHIDDFAEIAHSYRRELDRMAVDGEIEKVKWRGVTLIPAEFLGKFAGTEEPDNDRPERGEQQAGGSATGPEAEAEHGTETATPWEDLTYEPR